MSFLAAGQPALWGVILAAGDGKRMQPYIRRFTDGGLPKQYVNFIGRRSMLEHTFARAEKLIATERIVTVVGRQHLVHAEVHRQLAGRPRETVVVQPANKETAPGILLPLMFIHKRCPGAVVALLPSDHFILEEDRFMEHVALAAQAVRHDPERMVLLGVEPHEPQTEYGYILPQARDSLRRFGTRSVSAFVEKPDAEAACELVAAGGLWNTMAMVFQADAFLAVVRRVHAALYREFSRILAAIGTAAEQQTIDRTYDDLEPTNFSKGIMEKIAHHQPEAISVLPVRDVFWSDWGSPQRVAQVVGELYRQRSEEKQPGNEVGWGWECAAR